MSIHIPKYYQISEITVQNRALIVNSIKICAESDRFWTFPQKNAKKFNAHNLDSIISMIFERIPKYSGIWTRFPIFNLSKTTLSLIFPKLNDSEHTGYQIK